MKTKLNLKLNEYSLLVQFAKSYDNCVDEVVKSIHIELDQLMNFIHRDLAQYTHNVFDQDVSLTSIDFSGESIDLFLSGSGTDDKGKYYPQIWIHVSGPDCDLAMFLTTKLYDENLRTK
jgi:hypothetical protein